MLEFCPECRNMLSISVNGDKLDRKCLNCNFTKTQDHSSSAVLIASNNATSDIAHRRYMTKDIKYDPTLPRVKNIVCINEACSKPADVENQVIYIKYDYQNLNYLYFCCHCEHFWRREGGA